MMGARFRISGFLLLLATCEAAAGERAASLVNSFQIMCTLEPLNFAQSDAKATAMRLPVRRDLSKPRDSAGNFIRTKSWILPLKSGPHEFVIAEARGPQGDLKSCGIGAPDVDADDFRQELTKAVRLGRRIDESRSADGARRTTVWSYASGQKMTLVDGSPKSKPGIYMLLLKQPAER